ncbi:DUF4065 domain-containing protein [bacterium D16-51]|nr:DUF4065 domain-containing protein [bacterium D16-59]RKI55656.1 DUF4065 domain-containing protein [bacterium D16-51]
MRSAVEIASYIIWYCGKMKFSISNLKLQKILYFVQAEFLVNTNNPCFFEEIEAWDFGPVVPVVYRKYKVYGSSNIPTFFVDYNVKLGDAEKELVNGIVDVCADYTASELVEITHNQSPWRDNYKPKWNNVIPLNEIRDYFAED